MRALSIRQPWPWLILHGFKPVENREWSTSYRGPLLIHASLTLTQKFHRQMQAQLLDQFGIELPAFDALPRGGIVGRVQLVDVMTELDSPWFTGPYGFVLAKPEPLPFYPCKGSLGFFHVAAAELGLAPAL
ncbi:MAG: hypothetical protein C0423_13975 [Methylibium sp.]|nr:hypothetical protein [Methylibium sp.]